jgi:GTP cyclohydrolase II
VTITYVETCKLPTSFGMFEMHGFVDSETDKEHVALTMGNVGSGAPALVRVHSECLTGDALFSLRCDCGAQLQSAMHKIAVEGCGAVFYLRQEGRGIGLLNKIKAYQLQDRGADTVEANEALGFGADLRDYKILKPMFDFLNITQVKLLTNNPRKVAALTEMGISVVGRVPHVTGRNPHNQYYLDVKKG